MKFKDCFQSSEDLEIKMLRYESHHKSIIFLKCSCSDSLTDVLWVVSCKVWFGFRLLMQLASNTLN